MENGAAILGAAFTLSSSSTSLLAMLMPTSAALRAMESLAPSPVLHAKQTPSARSVNKLNQAGEVDDSGKALPAHSGARRSEKMYTSQPNIHVHLSAKYAISDTSCTGCTCRRLGRMPLAGITHCGTQVDLQSSPSAHMQTV